MTYAAPDGEARQQYLGLLLGSEPDGQQLISHSGELLNGCSFADIEQIVLKAKRKAIIAGAALEYRFVTEAYAEYNPPLLSNPTTFCRAGDTWRCSPGER
ncbi:hypothetical protein D3C79_992650 [compost metagenome]